MRRDPAFEKMVLGRLLFQTLSTEAIPCISDDLQNEFKLIKNETKSTDPNRVKLALKTLEHMQFYQEVNSAFNTIADEQIKNSNEMQSLHITPEQLCCIIHQATYFKKQLYQLCLLNDIALQKKLIYRKNSTRKASRALTEYHFLKYYSLKFIIEFLMTQQTNEKVNDALVKIKPFEYMWCENKNSATDHSNLSVILLLKKYLFIQTIEDDAPSNPKSTEFSQILFNEIIYQFSIKEILNEATDDYYVFEKLKIALQNRLEINHKLCFNCIKLADYLGINLPIINNVLPKALIEVDNALSNATFEEEPFIALKKIFLQLYQQWAYQNKKEYTIDYHSENILNFKTIAELKNYHLIHYEHTVGYGLLWRDNFHDRCNAYLMRLFEIAIAVYMLCSPRCFNSSACKSMLKKSKEMISISDAPTSKEPSAEVYEFFSLLNHNSYCINITQEDVNTHALSLCCELLLKKKYGHIGNTHSAFLSLGRKKNEPSLYIKLRTCMKFMYALKRDPVNPGEIIQSKKIKHLFNDHALPDVISELEKWSQKTNCFCFTEKSTKSALAAKSTLDFFGSILQEAGLITPTPKSTSAAYLSFDQIVMT